MERKIAFLVFPDWATARSKNKSFDGVYNIGAYMLIDVAERNGIKIDFCSIDSAREFDIVLVSLTSNYDMLSFYKSVRLHKDWQNGKRKFRVLCGGFGMQNPFLVIDFVDSFWFGRCEDEFINWLTIDDYEHESLMYPDHPKVCKIHQASKLYPNVFKLKSDVKRYNDFEERIYGCPNKCFFCHFSFARKHIKTGQHYQGIKEGRGHQELDMFNLEDIDYNCGETIIGLDGVSERLRFLVNKPIKDELVSETILNISNKTTAKVAFLKFYNISGYETETDEDYESFVEIVSRLKSKMKTKISLMLHTTPLQPSCATPMVFAPVNIKTKFSNKRGQRIIPDSEKLIVMHSPYNGGAWQQFCDVVVERFSEKYRTLADLICFNSKFNALKSDQKIDYCERHFDLGDLLRRYETTEQVPSWVCESYFGWETIRKMRDFMVKKIEHQNR